MAAQQPLAAVRQFYEQRIRPQFAPSPQQNMSRRLRSHVAVTAILAVATLVVFSPVLRSDFIIFDDPAYVTDNSHVLKALSWEGVRWAFTNLEGGFWCPLTWLSHMLDCQLFGLRAGWHHLTSLLLHAANTVLLFGVLRQMTGALWRSALVAALFALHPLHVESVAWVAERKDVLSTCFWLLTLWAYVRYVQTPAVRKQESEAGFCFADLRPLTSGPYWLVLLFFTCGLMSKAMVVTLPLELLLLDWWPLNRVAGFQFTVFSSDAERSTLDARPTTVLALAREKVPLLVLAALSIGLTLWAQHSVGAMKSLEIVPVGMRLENSVVSYSRYLGNAFWPVGLAVFYPYRAWPWGTVLGAGVLLAGLTGIVLWRRRREPYLLMGWLWYVGTLVPVIGLVQVGSQSMADRYTYVPLIGVFVMVAWGLAEGAGSRSLGRMAAGALAAGVLSACAAVSWRQACYWENSEMLFRHALNVTTDNALAHNSLGRVLFGQGRVAEAVAEYVVAAQIRPNSADAHCVLADALAEQGRLAEAVVVYQIALRLKPEFAMAHNNLANALMRQGKLAEAEVECRALLQLKPDFAEAHYNLANALNGQGMLAEAVVEYRAALRLKPEFGEAHNNLANTLLRQGRLAEAAAECQSALRIDSGSVEARYNLARILAAQGRAQQAMAEYRELLRRSPDWPPALDRLAWLLATHKDPNVRNGAEAVRLAERLCQITGNQRAEALDILAAADAEASRFNDAVKVAKQALALAESGGKTDLFRQIQERLKLYESGRPHRE